MDINANKEKKTEKNEIGKYFKYQKVSEIFGEQYLIANYENKKTSKNCFKGKLSVYQINKECKVKILKINGSFDQEIEDTTNSSETIKIIGSLSGKKIFFLYSDINSNTRKEEIIHIERSNILIFNEDGERKYKIKGKSPEIIIIDIHIDKIIKNLSEIADKNEIQKWKEKILKMFSNQKFYYWENDLEVEILIREIKKITSIININQYLKIKSEIEKLMFVIIQKQEKLSENIYFESSKMVTGIKKILRQYSIAELPTVTELCKIMKVSRYDLETSFKTVEKINIAKYLKKKKMEYSKLLLIKTDKNISEVAIETGYENSSKFSEAFKKYYGILPSKYRKENLKF